MEPKDIVEEYLRATESGDLDLAGKLLATDVELVFPHGTYRDLETLTRATASRYRRIAKSHVSWDVVPEEDGAAVVITTGTLSGENARGEPFVEVRFIDRFVVRGGRISRQEVWNDLAERGITRPTPGDTR